MSKHGVGSRDLVNGNDISGQVTVFEVNDDIDAVQTTAHQPNATNPAHSHIPGNEGGNLSVSIIWDPVTDALLAALLVNPPDNSIWTHCPGEDVNGQPCLNVAAVDTGFTRTTDVNDAVKADATAESVEGIESGIVHHALAAEVATGSSTAIDNLASTANGGSAWLHVTAGAAFGTLAVIVEQSATGAFGGEETTIATFTVVVAANVAERIEIALATTIERHTRFRWTFGAGLTSATFHGSLHRRP